jgi:GntR family transcriptional regulator
MLFKPDPASGVPIYVQLMDQVKHAIATGALRPGEQLPGIRRVAVELVMNPNTVAKAYRELEYEGVIELRHGAGAFIAEKQPSGRAADVTAKALPVIRGAIQSLEALGLQEDEIRRLFEGELLRLGAGAKTGEGSLQ